MNFGKMFERSPIKNKQEQQPANEKFNRLIDELKTLPGPQYMERLRELSNDPQFETDLENYTKDKRFRKDIQSGLFHIKNSQKNEPGHRSDFYKTIEHYYYPEEMKKARRGDRRLYGTVGGILGGLTIAVGVSYHQMQKDFKEQDRIEQSWEKQKLPLSIDEIDLQADTIFQGVKNNINLYHAYDTLNTHVDALYQQAHDRLENDTRKKITDHLDSLQAHKPEIFQGLVLEYWKSKNNIPNDYFTERYYAVTEQMDHFKDDFKKQKDTLDVQQKQLDGRVYQAYLAAGGDTMSWRSYVPPSNTETGSVPQKDQIQKPDSAQLAFEAYAHSIDSIMTPDIESYFLEMSGSPLSQEVTNLDSQIKHTLELMQSEQQNIQAALQREMDDKLGMLSYSEGLALNQTANSESKGFTKDVWAYLEDYYLSNEVFGGYDGITNSATSNELKVFEKDPQVMHSLKNIIDQTEEMRNETAAASEAIKTEYAQKIHEAQSQVVQKYAEQLQTLKDEYIPLKQQLSQTMNAKAHALNEKYIKLWNDELQKNPNKWVKPLEPTYSRIFDQN